MKALISLTTERDIPLDRLITAIEIAVKAAYVSTDDAKPYAHAKLDRETGEIRILVPIFGEDGEKIDEIVSLLPGMRSPTVLPLATAGWSSIHSVLNEDEFWDNIEKLRAAGAEGVLVVPIEKMIK